MCKILFNSKFMKKIIFGIPSQNLDITTSKEKQLKEENRQVTKAFIQYLWDNNDKAENVNLNWNVNLL